MIKDYDFLTTQMAYIEENFYKFEPTILFLLIYHLFKLLII
jgi:hypothetical protein